MAEENHYMLLGIPYNATEDKIREAYRELARIFHPDINKSEDAAEKFSSIQEAYSVLINPERRAEYDSSANIRFVDDPLFADFSDASEQIRKEKQDFDGFEEIYNPFTSLFKNKAARPRVPTSKNLNWFKAKLLGKKLPEESATLDSLNKGKPDTGFTKRKQRVSKKTLLGERIYFFTLSSEEAKNGTERKLVIKGEDGTAKSIFVTIPAGIKDGAVMKIPTPSGKSKEAVIRIRVED